MITFKQFITEARMAPLYHGTSAAYLSSIVRRGIRGETIQAAHKILKNDNQVGVSTTRSLKFAVSWVSGERNEGIVLEFDQQKLAQMFEIKPISYFTSETRGSREMGEKHYTNEFEEFVITGKRSIPFSYITRIYISRQYAKRWPEKYERDIVPIQQQYGSSFIRYYDHI